MLAVWFVTSLFFVLLGALCIYICVLVIPDVWLWIKYFGGLAFGAISYVWILIKEFLSAGPKNVSELTDFVQRNVAFY